MRFCITILAATDSCIDGLLLRIKPNTYVRPLNLFSSYIYINRRAESTKTLQEEEQQIKTANDRALAEMKAKMERELENAKLELLEV